MAKDSAITNAERTDTAIMATVDPEKIEPAFPGHGEPLAAAPAPQSSGPTAAQHEWLQKNPGHVRASHHFGRMVNRGTLHADGSFVPEALHPVMDGPDCFGVGIPVR